MSSWENFCKDIVDVATLATPVPRAAEIPGLSRRGIRSMVHLNRVVDEWMG